MGRTSSGTFSRTFLILRTQQRMRSASLENTPTPTRWRSGSCRHFLVAVTSKPSA
jgi:hypothetical protein